MMNKQKRKCGNGKLWLLSFAVLATPCSLVKAKAFELSSPMVTYVAKQQTVSGHVTDAATGNPVAGATITVRGTKTATQTDENGAYSIQASQGQILVSTSVGYKSL